MTILVSNGDFLIADKRISTTDTQTVYEHNASVASERTVVLVRDDCCKIIQPRGVKYEKEDVLAVGFTGSLEMMRRFIHALHRPRETAVDIMDIFADLCAFGAVDEKTLQILGILSSGETLRLSGDIDKTNARVTDNGTLDIIGSPKLPGVFLDFMINMFVSADVALDFFLAGAFTCTGCSTAYDAYSRAENLIVRDCRPTDEYAMSAFYRTRDLISPYHTTKQHHCLLKKD